jgi:hypothetical protein
MKMCPWVHHLPAPFFYCSRARRLIERRRLRQLAVCLAASGAGLVGPRQEGGAKGAAEEAIPPEFEKNFTIYLALHLQAVTTLAVFAIAGVSAAL